MPDPSPSSSAGPIRIDGAEQDAALSKSEFLTRSEVINRRSRRAKQLAGIYRDHYWALMEELKLKYREYYWEYGKSPFVEDEENEKINSSRADGAAGLAADNGNGNLGVNGGNGNVIGNATGRCGMNGCKAKAMALTIYRVLYSCTPWNLDRSVTLTKTLRCACVVMCNCSMISAVSEVDATPLSVECGGVPECSTTGPILCGKPILRSTVPSYCSVHFQKAEKYMVRLLKKSGLNIASTSKLAPKLHVLVADWIRRIQQKRRAAEARACLENAEIIEEDNKP
ncbi:hypothetical protein SASPL_136965 [Salvia splendens]|uniref:NSL complex protein NSL2 n=1 Tax=Salvia splendens TaxID=180675 RepID=A0A8X8ZGY8_SALSN|nr:hypothetical protein SASPL_136965 [Salvia splendens]